MLTVYSGLNVPQKGSLHEKSPKFYMKNKTYPVIWDQQSAKNYHFLKLFCSELNRCFATKSQTRYKSSIIIRA